MRQTLVFTDGHSMGGKMAAILFLFMICILLSPILFTTWILMGIGRSRELKRIDELAALRDSDKEEPPIKTALEIKLETDPNAGIWLMPAGIAGFLLLGFFIYLAAATLGSIRVNS